MDRQVSHHRTCGQRHGGKHSVRQCISSQRPGPFDNGSQRRQEGEAERYVIPASGSVCRARSNGHAESNQQAANGSVSTREPASSAAQAPAVNGHHSSLPNGPTSSAASDKMDTRADGNESDDSAMLESPVSEKNDKALFP